MAKKNVKKQFNGNNKKPVQKKQQRVIATFTKTVDTVAELLDVFNQLPGEAYRMLIEKGDINSLESLQKSVVDVFAENIPNIQDSMNTFWSLNMSMDKVFLKTGKFVGFGWSINKTFDAKTRSFNIDSIDIKFVTYDKMKAIDEINALFELGFEEIQASK